MEKTKVQSKSNESLWSKEFILITLSNLFLFFSFQMLIPTMPRYMEESGGDQFAVGLVVGIFTISALLIRPFAGKALDTLNRKYVLLIGLIIFAISAFSYQWTTTVLLILSLRFIHGIGWGITTTSFGTIVADIIPSKRRGEGMGYYGLSSTLGMALAPLIGIWIMNTKGFSFLFVTAAILALITLILTQFNTYSKGHQLTEEQEQSEAKKASLLDGLMEKRALFPSFLILLFAITYGGVVTFITIYGKEQGIENVGWFFMGNAFMVMLSRPIAGKIFDKKGHQAVLIPGVLLATIGLLILSYTTNVMLLVLASLFFGLGFGTIQPSLQAWTINKVPPHRRGAANATFFSAFDLGIGIGSMTLGIVAKWTSYSTMYRLSTILFGIFIITYLLYLKREKNISNSKA